MSKANDGRASSGSRGSLALETDSKIMAASMSCHSFKTPFTIHDVAHCVIVRCPATNRAARWALRKAG